MNKIEFISFDTLNFISQISNNSLNKNAFLIIDVATLICDKLQSKENYIDIKYELFDKNNNVLYKTPENVILNHRYPNKMYMCLTQKYGKKYSKNGCYIFDNIENLNKIYKIKFYFCPAHIDNAIKNSICLVFIIKPNFTQINTFSKIKLAYCLDKGGIYFNFSNNPNNDIILNYFNINEKNANRIRIDKNTIEFNHINELNVYNSMIVV